MFRSRRQTSCHNSLSVVFALFAVATLTAAAEDRINVRITTSHGLIEIALNYQHAPQAVDYFLSFIDNGRYSEGVFYRSASFDENPERQMIQGGILLDALNSDNPSLEQFAITPLMEFETTEQSGLRHQRGSVSLARDLLNTGGAIPELCFYLRDTAMLDAGGKRSYDQRGFPVIGEVTAGLSVIESISAEPRSGATTIPFLRGEILTQPVAIISIERLPDPL